MVLVITLMTIQSKNRHSVTQDKFSFSYTWEQAQITWVIKHPQSPEQGGAPGGRYRFRLLQDWSSVPAQPFITCRNLTCSQDTVYKSLDTEMHLQRCHHHCTTTLMDPNLKLNSSEADTISAPCLCNKHTALKARCTCTLSDPVLATPPSILFQHQPHLGSYINHQKKRRRKRAS